MNVDSITLWRSRVSKASTLLCVLFALAVLDGVVSLVRQPVDVFNVLPGDTVKVNGPLKPGVQSVNDLEYTSTSDLVKVSFDALHAGYWMGGAMWRGQVEVSPESAAGEYSVTVGLREDHLQTPSAVFRIIVHRDINSYHQSSKSLLERTMGISPWWAMAGLAVLIGAGLLALYFISGRRDELLAREGRAEIYHIRPVPNGFEVSFGLGTRNGVQAGSRLTLLDKGGQPAGEIEVLAASDSDATGLVGLNRTVKPGYSVLKL